MSFTFAGFFTRARVPQAHAFTSDSPRGPAPRLMCIRPADPQKAIEAAMAIHDARKRGRIDAREFERRFQQLIERQPYRFAGYVKQPLEHGPEKAVRLVDKAGNPAGWTMPGDSFVNQNPQNEAAAGVPQEIAQWLIDGVALWSFESHEAAHPSRASEALHILATWEHFRRALAKHFGITDFPPTRIKSEPCSPNYDPGDYAAANAKLIAVNAGLLELAAELDQDGNAEAGRSARQLHAAIVAYYSRWHVPE